MEEVSKHRMKLPLYDLEPKTENCWIAPNATLGKLIIMFIDCILQLERSSSENMLKFGTIQLSEEISTELSKIRILVKVHFATL